VNDDDNDEQTRTNTHALSGIRTHGLRVQANKAYASDSTATGTSSNDGKFIFTIPVILIKMSQVKIPVSSYFVVLDHGKSITT
jgi:3D (Asp-Asp-Asp) domain-containing protein